MSASAPLVLVADDAADILALVRAALTGAGYEVVTAADGEAALEGIRSQRPALAVLDVSMPKLDGLTVLARVREDPAFADLPVILLSALAQESDVARGYELGASRYVRKPFSPRELIGLVGELVDARQPGL
jgi:two-component system response regulator MtrA